MLEMTIYKLPNCHRMIVTIPLPSLYNVCFTITTIYFMNAYFSGYLSSLWPQRCFPYCNVRYCVLPFTQFKKSSCGFCSNRILYFFLLSVCQSPAWHLNFSQSFDDLGHEKHIFSESISSRVATLTTFTTWPPDHLTTWPLDHLITWPPDHLTAWPPDRLTTWPPDHPD